MGRYVGDDGHRYRDPCTSKRGKKKERWPNEKAAWFVVELAALGMHRVRGKAVRLYPYLCPKCDGWHLATCRTDEHLKRHRAALASIRADRDGKSPQSAPKNGH